RGAHFFWLGRPRGLERGHLLRSLLPEPSRGAMLRAPFQWVVPDQVRFSIVSTFHSLFRNDRVRAPRSLAQRVGMRCLARRASKGWGARRVAGDWESAMRMSCGWMAASRVSLSGSV